MVTIDRRVGALESFSGIGGGGGECPECGGAIPPNEAHNRYTFVYRNHTEAAQDEWCSVCGRPLVKVLRWEE
jgi:hypothetical protein